MTAPLAVAAVGLGWVTTHRHIPAVAADRDAVLVGAVDRRRERIDELVARRVAVPRTAVAQDPSDIPWLPDVEAVTIGTSPDAHHGLAQAFLRAGKHVLVEKPMTMTPDESDALVALARQTGRVLAVVHNFQFSRAARRVRRLLDGGSLGELRAVWGLQSSSPGRRLPVWYETLPLGLFYDESPHLLYLLRHFLGDALTVASADVRGSTEGRATPAWVSARLEGGRAPGKIDMYFEAPISEWQLAVIGSRRLALVDIFRDIAVVLRNDGEHRAHEIMRSSMSAISGHVAGVVSSGSLLARRRLLYGNDEVMRRFVDACRGGREPGAVAGSDGRDVVHLMHAVVAAS